MKFGRPALILPVEIFRVLTQPRRFHLTTFILSITLVNFGGCSKMAILKRVRANVYVEGQSVTEYNPIEDLQVDGGGNEITKYIESQEGQEFYIEAGPLDTATGYINSTGLTVECFVDGACVSYTFAEPGHSTKCRGCEYMKEGVKYLQRFEFSKIRTSKHRKVFATQSLYLTHYS